MTSRTKSLLGFAAPLFGAGALAACSPLGLINAVTPGGASAKSLAIKYGEHERNELDIYRPRNTKEAAPVVVFFYGGSWNSGARKDYAFVGEALAARGIVTVVPDYRLYPEVRYPEFIEDSAQAVAWALKQIQDHGGDPNRVFVMGHSAGAYNAAMVALDQRFLAEQGVSPASLGGLIGLAGPYDFIPISNPDVRPVFFHPNTPPSSQPVHHVTAAAPPALLIASHNDNMVNAVRNTGGLAKQLRSAGVPVREIYFDNTSHASLIGAISWPLRSHAPVLDTVVDFIHKHGATRQQAKVAVQ